jgi:glycosyltransferase involved in cell wall biosynthesis
MHDPGAIAQWRERFDGSAGSAVIGHFGTYGDHVVRELEPFIPALLQARPDAQFVCIGRGSERFVAGLRDRHTDIAARVHSAGTLPPFEVAAAIHACDLIVQPYPDGITTRRTSVMAALANGVATVSTTGALTERIWTETGAVALVPASNPRALAHTVIRLLNDPAGRAALAAAGRRTYDAHFAIGKTVDALFPTGVPTS